MRYAKKANSIIKAKLEISLLEFVEVVEPLLLVLVEPDEFVGGGVTDPVQFNGQLYGELEQTSQPYVTLSYTYPQKHLVQCKPSVAAQLVLMQDAPLGPK